MEREQFAGEIKDYISSVYKDFLSYQEITNRILKEFIGICKQYDITYYMAFGSLIGAIRERGNIPWDYDVDVVVPVTQREKLIKALDNLHEDFYYAYFNNMINYPTSCLRVGLKPFPFTALHVDVFFLVACPDGDAERNIFLKDINNVADLRGMKYLSDWFYEPNPNSKLKKLANFYMKLRAKLIPKLYLRREEKLLTKHKLGTTKYCFILGQNDKKLYFEYSWFEKRIFIETKLGKLSVPAGYHQILTKLYGDYMRYYSIENRFDEMYGLYKIIKKRVGVFQKV